MSITRSHVLLVFGLLAGGSGLAVIFEPQLIPPDVRQFRSLLTAQLVSRFAIGLGAFVVLVAIFRLLKSGSAQVNRSPIAQTPPELVTADQAANTDSHARLAYRRTLTQFESPDHSTRLVAIYGRRAQSATAVDDNIEQYLDGLAAVVANTYATSVGCDKTTATHAVETGQWTDDRIAAAFLATDLDSDISFTPWERFTAWLTPERVFSSRVQRVLDAAEVHAGTFLTYESTTSETSHTSGAAEPNRSAEQRTEKQTRPSEALSARADAGESTENQHTSAPESEPR